MPCGSCESVNETELTAEMMIHFHGPIHLANPGVLVFPKVLVCLDCGFLQINLPEGELGLLRKGLAS
jgi:hypothetical protein